MPIDYFTPLNALRNLPGSGLQRPDPNQSMELQHYALLDQLKSEAEDAANRQQAGDIPQQYYLQGDPGQRAITTPDPQIAALKGLTGIYSKDLEESSVGQSRPFVQAYDKAQQEAQLQGYNAQGGDTIQSPSASAARAQRAMEMAKIQAPIDVERAKTQGQMQLEADRANRLMQIFGRPGAGKPAVGQTPDQTGQVQVPDPNVPSQAPKPQAQAGPLPSPSWWDIITGKGAAPYSSLKDWLGARSERAKYDAGFPTPFAPLAQETSFANLSQIQAMFPGIRGVQHLLQKFSEHQANWGHETPAASLQRLQGMEGMLSDLENEFDDPSLRFKTGPTGQLELAMPPQAITRAKILTADTRAKLASAKAVLLQQYPKIQEALQQAITGQGAPMPAPGGRFTPEP